MLIYLEVSGEGVGILKIHSQLLSDITNKAQVNSNKIIQPVPVRSQFLTGVKVTKM